MKCLLISTLAEYQTRFWVEVGDALKARGIHCAFLSFDDRSTHMLEARGFTVYSRHSVAADAAEPTMQHCLDALASYGITTPERWFLHERYAYGEQDPDCLLRKLHGALRLASHAITQCKATHAELSVVQEVGGFLSVVGCYFAAQQAQLPHWFIEPAFFKGRLFFTPDGFNAPTIVTTPSPHSLPQVRHYLDEALATQRVVIPEKDRRHYSSALKKLRDPHNLRRLVEKTFDKYVLGKKQEFGYLGRQVGMHLRMLVNSHLLRGSYTPLGELDDFVYFPLHVPGDMALTLRSPEYVDQLALLEHILRATPATHKVAVKEHPAMIGALSARRLRQLRRRHPQLRIIAPSTNNYDVLGATSLVVSINSKSGAEALLLDKPVIVLGDAFYAHSPLVHAVGSPRALQQAIPALLQKAPPIARVVEFFHAVWDSSYPGELYVTDPAKLSAFTDALVTATATSSHQPAAPAYGLRAG